MTSRKPLWQHGLDWLHGTEPTTHWSDRDRAYELARGLRKLGAQPPWGGEVSRYARTLFPDQHVLGMVHDCWASAHRAKTSRGRARHARSNPLYVPDMLIRDHALRPTTGERLAAVARDAINALVAADNGRAYRALRAELAAAIVAIDEFRVLRKRV